MRKIGYNTFESDFKANQNEDATLKGIIDTHYDDNTLESKNEEPVVFKLIKHRLSYEGSNLFDKEGKNKDEIEQQLSNTELVQSINSLLKRFLKLNLKITLKSSIDWTFSFNIQKNDKDIDFKNLSAGEKGIIHLIFSLYGYDIEEGLILIDEPELHLHPQLQKKYLMIMEQESKNRDVQFIIATHSPIFISEKTINSTLRFYFDEVDSTSKTVTPSITENELFLVKILNYTNASKIFFVNKAI